MQATESLERILDRIDEGDVEALELLRSIAERDPSGSWRGQARAYRSLGEALLRDGRPASAFELLREGAEMHSAERQLEYLCALALARGGSLDRAQELLDRLALGAPLDPPLEAESLCLSARLEKDRYQRARTAQEKAKHAERSARLYETAYRVSGGAFAGVNAAAMRFVAGEPARARELAAEVLGRVAPEGDYWSHATRGELNLILGRMDEAAHCYERAIALAGPRLGDVASMRRNVELLAQKEPSFSKLLDSFGRSCVVVFTGHMLDRPGRTPARFPDHPPLVEAVRKAIGEGIDHLDARIGFCSIACGSDVLFAEEMLRRGREVHVVLPFARADFFESSVDYGSGWRARAEAVLAQVESKGGLHHSSTERFLGDEGLFAFCNTVTEGLAGQRAGEIGGATVLLAVRDPASPPNAGGTVEVVGRWATAGRQIRLIDLQRAREAFQAPPPVVVVVPDRAPRERTPTRLVRSMLFGDVRNFSRLNDEMAPAFFGAFLETVAAVIRCATRPPAFWNTWGDGLFLVFESPAECADFALSLLERFGQVDFGALGLPDDTTLRIGVHAGPVFSHPDPLLGRTNYFGANVNRAARIEPVTTPGSVFVSEQFAAALCAESEGFICEYVGVEWLAKSYDRCSLYRIARA